MTYTVVMYTVVIHNVAILIVHLLVVTKIKKILCVCIMFIHKTQNTKHTLPELHYLCVLCDNRGRLLLHYNQRSQTSRRKLRILPGSLKII